MGKFDGRIALVTNAGGATGKGICAQLEKDGATVVAADFDVATVDGWEKGLAAIGDAHGRLDILVTISEAKYDKPKPIAETSLEEFRAVNRDNIEAAFLATRYGVVKMREFGNGGYNELTGRAVAFQIECIARYLGGLSGSCHCNSSLNTGFVRLVTQP